MRWAVLLGLGGALGCASTGGRDAAQADCDFAFYETQAPARPYEVIGEVPLTTNEWMNMGQRKALLRRAACGAGADGVLLGPATERTLVSGKRLREYRARLLVFRDTPRTQAPPPREEPPLPPGTVPVPVMMNGLKEDLTGTETRDVDGSGT